MTVLANLSKDELLELLYAYDDYLERARENDAFAEGWIPVCIHEFYDHEFLEAKE